MWGLALGGKDSVDTSKASDEETWSSAHKEGNPAGEGTRDVVNCVRVRLTRTPALPWSSSRVGPVLIPQFPVLVPVSRCPHHLALPQPSGASQTPDPDPRPVACSPVV